MVPWLSGRSIIFVLAVEIYEDEHVVAGVPRSTPMDAARRRMPQIEAFDYPKLNFIGFWDTKKIKKYLFSLASRLDGAMVIGRSGEWHSRQNRV